MDHFQRHKPVIIKADLFFIIDAIFLFFLFLHSIAKKSDKPDDRNGAFEFGSIRDRGKLPFLSNLTNSQKDFC